MFILIRQLYFKYKLKDIKYIIKYLRMIITYLKKRLLLLFHKKFIHKLLLCHRIKDYSYIATLIINNLNIDKNLDKYKENAKMQVNYKILSRKLIDLIV